MNATPPVFPAQRGNDALQLSPSGSAASEGNRARSRDFAATLNDADAKPARKSSAHREHDTDSSGSQLPSPGNQPPPAIAPPPPARPEAASASQNDSAVGDVASSTQGGTAQGGTAQSGTAQGGTAQSGTAQGIGVGPNAPAGAPGKAVNDISNAAGGGPPVAAPVTANPAATIAPAPTLDAASVPAAATARAPAAPLAVTSDAKPIDGAASKAAIAAATSGPTSTDGTAAALNNTAPDRGPASAGTDTTAQALMAAATAQSNGAPPTNSSLPVQDLTIAYSDATLKGAPAANDSQGSAVPDAPAPQSQAGATSAAVTAATAASIAQAVLGAASAGVTDKHLRDSSPDSSSSGITNDGSAGVAQLLSAPSPTTDTASVPTLKVSANVDSGEFGQGVADRVSLMMDNNLTSAKLQVNPPSLGPIEVRIALQAGHAQVWFTSHSAVTRDALESTAPTLREMLGAQGFGQVSVDISQRSFQERSPPSKGYESAPAISAESAASVQTAAAVSRAANGLLDAYA